MSKNQQHQRNSTQLPTTQNPTTTAQTSDTYKEGLGTEQYLLVGHQSSGMSWVICRAPILFYLPLPKPNRCLKRCPCSLIAIEQRQQVTFAFAGALQVTPYPQVCQESIFLLYLFLLALRLWRILLRCEALVWLWRISSKTYQRRGNSSLLLKAFVDCFKHHAVDSR